MKKKQIINIGFGQKPNLTKKPFFVGFAAMIGYIIKNSLQKKTPEFLHNEKIEMENKVLDLKKELQANHLFSVDEITNDIKYSYSKAMSNKLSTALL